jgi:hypothetical protein
MLTSTRPLYFCEHGFGCKWMIQSPRDDTAGNAMLILAAIKKSSASMMAKLWNHFLIQDMRTLSQLAGIIQEVF